MRRRVALVMPTSTSYSRGVLRGVARYVQTHENWSLDLVPSWMNPPADMPYWEGHGFIAHVNNEDLFRAVQLSKKPAVNISDSRNDWPLAAVWSDNQAIGRLAARHFLERGFTRLAFMGLLDEYYSTQRREGFHSTIQEARGAPTAGPGGAAPGGSAAMPEAGCSCEVLEVGQTKLGWGPNMRRMIDWLKALHAQRPVGVMAANDDLARLIVEICLNQGILVPEGLAVVGVDDDEVICELLEVPLTSVAPNAERIGFEAAGLLDRLLAGEAPPNDPMLVRPVGVVERRSSDILAVDDPEVVQAVRFIRDHARQPIGVDDVVVALSVCRRSLERRFLRVLGRSPSAEILRVRTEFAQRLLRDTDLPVSKVAANAGFTDASHLSCCLRRSLGQTPTAYRRQQRLG